MPISRKKNINLRAQEGGKRGEGSWGAGGKVDIRELERSKGRRSLCLKKTLKIKIYTIYQSPPRRRRNRTSVWKGPQKTSGFGWRIIKDGLLEEILYLRGANIGIRCWDGGGKQGEGPGRAPWGSYVKKREKTRDRRQHH